MQSNVLELPAQGSDEDALKDLMAACSIADCESSSGRGWGPSGRPAGLNPLLLFVYVVRL